MRIARVISTGEFLEMQSAATPGTLIQNAVAAGYDPKDVVELEVTAAEFQRIAQDELTSSKSNVMQLVIDYIATKVDAPQEIRDAATKVSFDGEVRK